MICPTRGVRPMIAAGIGQRVSLGESVALTLRVGGNLYAATATTKVNRKDFGLNWNKALEAGGVALGDDAQLTVDLELTDSPPAAKKEAQAESKPAK